MAPLSFLGHLYNLDPIRNFRQQFTRDPKPRRFAFLVIGGKSYSGKTEFAKTLFPNPYESNAFNFNGYDYRKNGCIIFNDVVGIVDHICANKELFQSSERLATVNRSATMMYAAKVRVLNMPIIITINTETPDWLAFQSTDQWLLANSEVLNVQRPLYEGNADLQRQLDRRKRQWEEVDSQDQCFHTSSQASSSSVSIE